MPRACASCARRLRRYYADQHGVVASTRTRSSATMGSSAGFILAFTRAFRPGAKIAVTRPGYPAYVNTLAGLGFGAVEIPLTAAQWLAADRRGDRGGLRARAVRRAAVCQSPANPTGAAVTREGLAEIVATCARLGVRLISDEIYHGLDYRGPSVSALELTRDAIVINSFSKYYCMTGWRIGWMVLPDDLLRRARNPAAEPVHLGADAEPGRRDGGAGRARLCRRAEGRTMPRTGCCWTTGCAPRLRVDEATARFTPMPESSRFTNDSLASARDCWRRRAWRRRRASISTASTASASCGSPMPASARRWSRRWSGWRDFSSPAPGDDGRARV